MTLHSVIGSAVAAVDRYVSAEEAVAHIRSGNRVYVHGMASAPHNPQVAMLDIEYVNDPDAIRRNPKVVAINGAIEVDLTGQVCADSIGSRLYSGVGGQMDFMRGASQSVGGKSVIALPSQTEKGVSRIVATLKQGAGVVTTRAHVHYVVTEYGIANLHGLGIRKRVKALIHLAHPGHRERLAREAAEILGVSA